jgi:tetratricopeptide (TPR) repeat protein
MMHRVSWHLVLVLAACIGSIGGATRAEEIKSLPLWTKPDSSARRQLGDVTRSIQQGIVLVGSPKGGHGTAWVVSREHRLLVTNAHVADIMAKAGKMAAIPNGTSDVYRVERIWYHPGVRRYLAGGSVRSIDPREGSVDPLGPDLAVLQLAAGGPDLPVEWPLATPEELKDLFAQPAGIVGFPGHDTEGWPSLGDKAAATYHDGVISRITDFRMSPSGPPEEQQYVQYTMATWPGFSGSPVFLSNGHVVAIHNMGRTVPGNNGVVASIPYGVRVDCLWELLLHHKLDAMVKLPVDKSKLRIARWLERDERDEQLRKAISLVAEADRFVYTTEEFAKGVNKCLDAIKLAPNYPEAYFVRAHGFMNYWFKYKRQLSYEDQMKLLKNAAENADKYTVLAPSDPRGVLLGCLILNNLGHASKDYSFNRKALNRLIQLANSDNLTDYVQAEIHSNMGIACDNLDDKDEALRHHNEAIRLAPYEPMFYENRADFWHYLGRSDLEQADYAKARAIRQKNALR